MAVSPKAGYDPIETSEVDGEAAAGEPSNVATAQQIRASRIAVLQLLGACLAWLGCSSGIILVNRIIMKELGFGFPMALSALGQGVSCLISWFLCDVIKVVAQSSAVTPRFFFTNIAPVGVAQGVGMWLSNKLYQLLTVAFIEMARALLPLITMLALWVAQLETPTSEHVKAVSLTAIGCGVSAYGEVALSSLGLLCLVLNFTTEAARMVMMQFLMQGKEMGPWQSMKLMTLPAFLMLALMASVLELPTMRQQDAGAIVMANPAIFAAAGCLGVAVTFLSMVIIKLSSATTVKLLAAIRGPLVVLSGVLLLAEIVTPLQFLGYSLALAGFVWYNIAKARTPAAPAALKARP